MQTISPQVNDMVFMVPSVQMHIVGVNEQETKQDEQNLQRVLATIHKVPVEDIWFLT